MSCSVQQCKSLLAVCDNGQCREHCTTSGHDHCVVRGCFNYSCLKEAKYCGFHCTEEDHCHCKVAKCVEDSCKWSHKLCVVHYAYDKAKYIIYYMSAILVMLVVLSLSV